MFRSTLAIAAILLVAMPAPAMAGHKKDPKMEAALERLAATPVTCADEADCRLKWARAVAWVAENSAFKIQIANDTLIQTFGPSGYIHGTAFIVTRMPAASGEVFDLRPMCESQPYCGLSPRDYKAKFAVAVMNP